MVVRVAADDGSVDPRSREVSLPTAVLDRNQGCSVSAVQIAFGQRASQGVQCDDEALAAFGGWVNTRGQCVES